MKRWPNSCKRVLWLALALTLTGCRPNNAVPPPPAADSCAPSAAITLETGWRFRTDPADIGLLEEWFSPEFNDTEWQELAPGKPWEFSGLEYDGIAWYRTQVTLPDWTTVYLGFGKIDDAATLWVAGEQVETWQAIGARPIILDLLQFARPGDQLDLAFRIEDHGDYGGIKQPLRLSFYPHEVMTGAQYITWLADFYPDWPLPGQGDGYPFAWTMTGLQDAADEALLSSEGAVAPWATAPIVDIWLYDPITGELASGTGNDLNFSLTKHRLPIPRWEWEAFGVTVKSVLFGNDRAIRWQVTAHNATERERETLLLVTIRPFTVDRRLAPICAVGMQGTERLWVNGEPFMAAETLPDKAGVGQLDEVMAHALQGEAPAGEVLTSIPAGDGAAVWAYSIRLNPGESITFPFSFPSAPGSPFPVAGGSADAQLAETTAAWEKATGRTTLDLPDDLIESGVSASLGYLLLALDPDGPHPGPLVHDALWVRDAAYIGLALLQFGHSEAVQALIPAVLSAQEADGRVPPIQGEKIPWDDDEWDSQGEAIFLVTSYYRYTGDRETLSQWYPALRAAAQFIVELRATRAEVEGPSAGLLPPSKSAEDLGPADWHHYWDNFWSVIGLEEAAFAARELGETQDALELQAEADALRDAILASVEAVMGSEPAYIPGSVEDIESSAMARGTVTALWPVPVFPPEMPLLARSFDHYHQLWIAPHEGGFRHRQGQFWAYGGLELAHAYLRLGRTDVLHQILGWTLTHQTLPGTFAWAEQVDPSSGDFSGGDMPHAWAAASYATLVREMLISERDDTLELFSGVPDSWFGAGQVISLENAPTHFGALNLQTKSTVEQSDTGWQGTLTLTLSSAPCRTAECGNFRWQLPQEPTSVDGPAGTVVDDGWLLVPGEGGTVEITFAPAQ